MLFQKKGTLSQKQPNFTSSDDKHGDKKNCFPNKKFQNKKCALAGRIKEFLPAWKLLTKDQELLALVEGYQIPLLVEPVQEKTPTVPKLN